MAVNSLARSISLAKVWAVDSPNMQPTSMSGIKKLLLLEITRRLMPPVSLLLPLTLKTAVNLSGRGSFCGRQGRRASGCEHECGERAGENRSQAFGIGPLLRSGFQ